LIVEKKADQADSAKGHGHGPGGHSH
jgi:hypothetical protein